jgi:hypothetical protein
MRARPGLAQYGDTSAEADKGRARLRQKCEQHTYSLFKAQTDLLFSVVRDVYRFIARDFASGQRRIRDLTLPAPRPISRPVAWNSLPVPMAPILLEEIQL